MQSISFSSVTKWLNIKIMRKACREIRRDFSSTADFSVHNPSAHLMYLLPNVIFNQVQVIFS